MRVRGLVALGCLLGTLSSVAAARSTPSETIPFTAQQQAVWKTADALAAGLGPTGGRQTATTNWAAGARIVSGTDREQCSTGFTGRAPDGSRWVLTGYHCVNPHDTRILAPKGYVGRATVTDQSLDLAAVRTTATTPSIWTGDWNGGTASRVTAVTAPRVGMKICTSGSFSGLRCTATVRGTVAAALKTNWGIAYTASLWYATSDDGSEIIRSGDSGGPVFARTGAGTVTAVGIISAGFAGGVPCVGAPGGSAVSCYQQVLFSPVATDAATLHLDLTR